MTSFEDLENLILQLSNSDNIIITSHKDPDGDAIGSMLAWKRGLELKGLSSYAILPNAITHKFSWMANFNEVIVAYNNLEKTKKIFESADVIIILDYNHISRAGNISEQINNSKAKKIVVDHHPYPQQELADILISKISVSSTCELSYEIFKALNWKMDSDVAEALYTGIMTDTGILNHNSSHPEIYNYIAELLEIGVDKDKIHNKVFNSNSIDRIQLFGHALCNKLNLLPSKIVATISLSQNELKQFNFKLGDTEGLVNEPLSIEGVEISAFFLEKENGETKISFRSLGDYAVNEFSEKYFNGGGHKNAAGGSFKGTIDEAMKIFNKKAEAFFNLDSL